MAADGAETLVKVATKRWGDVYVRPINVATYTRVGRLINERRAQDAAWDKDAENALIALHVVCDESGKLEFDPESIDDFKFVAARRGSDVGEIVNAATGTADAGN